MERVEEPYTQVRSRERLLEMIPGALVWTAILLPFVLSFSYPTLVAYFIIMFDLYWFFKAFYMSRNLLNAYFVMTAEQKIEWYKKLGETKDIETIKEDIISRIKEHKKNIYAYIPFRFIMRISKHYRKKIGDLKYLERSYEFLENVKQDDVIDYRDIYHLVILATYEEDVSILRDSIQGVADSNFPNEKIFFVLAGEERDKERFLHYAKELEKEFENIFGFFLSTVHPKDIPGEIKGKGGNITFAARQAREKIDTIGIPHEKVVVTTLDADNIVHTEYFGVLTYRYVINKDRIRRSFQPMPIFNNNIWEVPAPVRIIAMGNGFWQLIESTRPERLRNFSSHAQSLKTLDDTDFWSTSTIVEDGHQFWRTFFRYDGDHQIVPIFVPIYQDAVQEKTFRKTMKAQYIQIRRWAWGASDFPYVFLNLKRNNKIPFWQKGVALYRMMEGYFFWATAPIFITLIGWIPGLINPSFKYTVVAFNLPQITSTLMTIATIGIFVNIMISILLLPPRPRQYSKFKHLMMALQWILLPLVTIFFSAIPAIDAQTRLMIGKRLDWKVTKKMKRA